MHVSKQNKNLSMFTKNLHNCSNVMSKKRISIIVLLMKMSPTWILKYLQTIFSHSTVSKIESLKWALEIQNWCQTNTKLEFFQIIFRTISLKGTTHK